MPTVTELEAEIARLNEKLAIAKGIADTKQTLEQFKKPILTQIRQMPIKYWVWVGVVVLVLGTIQFGIYSIVKRAKDLAIAEERDRTAKIHQAETDRLKAEHVAQEAAIAKRFKELTEQMAKRADAIAKRNPKTDEKIEKVRSQKPIEDVAQDVKDILGFEPRITGPQTLESNIQHVQEWVALKLDRDRLSDNLIDTKEQLQLETERRELVEKDLASTKAQLSRTEQQSDDWREVAMSYKKVAKKGFGAKMLGVGKFIGQTAITVAIFKLFAQ